MYRSQDDIKRSSSNSTSSKPIKTMQLRTTCVQVPNDVIHTIDDAVNNKKLYTGEPTAASTDTEGSSAGSDTRAGAAGAGASSASNLVT